MVELMLGGVLPACYFGMCQKSIFHRRWRHSEMCTYVCSCVVYLFAFHLCGRVVNQSELAEIAVTLYCVLNMNRIPGIAAPHTPPGSLRWNGMKSTAVVTRAHALSCSNTHTNRQPNYSVSLPFSLWLIQAHARAQIPTKLDKEIRISICRSLGQKTNLLLTCLFAFFSRGWLSHLPGNQMMASRRLTQRHTPHKSPGARIQQSNSWLECYA